MGSTLLINQPGYALEYEKKKKKVMVGEVKYTFKPLDVGKSQTAKE